MCECFHRHVGHVGAHVCALMSQPWFYAAQALVTQHCQLLLINLMFCLSARYLQKFGAEGLPVECSLVSLRALASSQVAEFPVRSLIAFPPMGEPALNVFAVVDSPFTEGFSLSK